MNDDQAAIMFGGQTLSQVGPIFTILAAEMRLKELRIAHGNLLTIVNLMGSSITALEVEEILKHVR